MNKQQSHKILSIDNISSNESKEIIGKFFDKNLDKILIYEVIFENKNMRHIISQFIRIYSLLLSIRMLKFIPPSLANHVGQIFNRNDYWYFSEIIPKQNYKIENFVEFLSNKIQCDNFYGRIYIRPKDIKPENWEPCISFFKYSVVKAFLSGVLGLIFGIITYKVTDPLKFYAKPASINNNSKPKKKSIIDFKTSILLLLFMPLILFVAIFRCISSFLIKRSHQICSSVGDVYAGTMLDAINACSRVPTPQDWLLYGNVIRFNSEICVARHVMRGYQNKDKFIDKQKKMDNESSLTIEVSRGKNIKVRNFFNIVLNRYLNKGAKYPDYLPW
jgi:hypothetical protein